MILNNNLKLLINYSKNKEKNASLDTFWSCNIASHYMKYHPSLEALVYITEDEVEKLKNLII